MSVVATPIRRSTIEYPDDDGEPMADNTWQFRWIVLLAVNAEAYFRNAPNVFVAGNHLIYPVEGRPDIRFAPDMYVAFGRPKMDRGSYKVWEEGGVFPQVVFEVWSPNNRFQQMEDKRSFYERYGAEEYYIVYPEFPCHMEGWMRSGGVLERIANMNGHLSPRLGFRFAVDGGEIAIFGPDGRDLRPAVEIAAEREAAEQARVAAEQARVVAEQAREAADHARQAAERELTAERAGRVAEQERLARLAAKLRELGIDPGTE